MLSFEHAIQHYKIVAREWIVLRYETQKLMLKAIRSLPGSYSEHADSYVAVCKEFGISNADKNVAENRGDKVIGERVRDLPIRDDRLEKKDRSEIEKVFLAPTLFWLSYYFPDEARVYFESIKLDFQLITEHPRFPKMKSITYEELGLILPEQHHSQHFELQMHFSNEGAKFVGREEEINQLNQFLLHDENKSFKWWQISGEAGQGKSRLAHHFIKHRMERSDEWEAGFIERFDHEFLEKVKRWRPARNTLIVIDYAASPEKSDRLLDLMHLLFGDPRRPADWDGFRVRLLILDRQPYSASSRSSVDFGPNHMPSLWQYRLMIKQSAEPRILAGLQACHDTHNGPIVLMHPGKDVLLQIADEWAHFRSGSSFTPMQRELVAQFLGVSEKDEQLDLKDANRKRPLIAQIATEAVLAGELPNIDSVDILEDLLDFVLDADLSKMFEPDAPRDRTPAMIYREHSVSLLHRAIAIIANIVSHLYPSRIRKLSEILPDTVDMTADDLDKINKLTGHLFHDEQESGIVFGRTPDLLSERQFLREISKMPPYLREKLLNFSWTHDGEATFAFLSHLGEDFPRNQITPAVIIGSLSNRDQPLGAIMLVSNMLPHIASAGHKNIILRFVDWWLDGQEECLILSDLFSCLSLHMNLMYSCLKLGYYNISGALFGYYYDINERNPDHDEVILGFWARSLCEATSYKSYIESQKNISSQINLLMVFLTNKDYQEANTFLVKIMYNLILYALDDGKTEHADNYFSVSFLLYFKSPNEHLAHVLARSYVLLIAKRPVLTYRTQEYLRSLVNRCGEPEFSELFSMALVSCMAELGANAAYIDEQLFSKIQDIVYELHDR
ncbi:ATP-binding protein [Ponticaulis koreensis]|uniref:ATP-binding protein n=1 Tax=Ponticaulis koreensis TaxID=1123045 RepID=UPI0003B6AE33|nr:ATP-binding protein [Ponticaulis koreensis]